MGINERKEREKVEMRKQILDTAMKLFLEEGFHNVSLRRIAEKIEYSPATIYLYFKDKDEILYSLHTAGFEELYKRQQETLTITNTRERLIKHGEVYLRFGLENPEYYNLMFIMRSPARKFPAKDEWDAGMRSYDIFRGDVKRGMDEGILRQADVDMVTFALWTQVHGIVALMLRHRCPMFEEKDFMKIALNTFYYSAEKFGISTSVNDDSTIH